MTAEGGPGGRGLDGELLAKPSKDKLQSVRPRACCMGSAGFGPPRLAGKGKKVMREEGWGQGNNRLGQRLVAEHTLHEFQKKT